MELSLLSSLPVDCSTRDVARVLGMADWEDLDRRVAQMTANATAQDVAG